MKWYHGAAVYIASAFAGFQEGMEKKYCGKIPASQYTD